MKGCPDCERRATAKAREDRWNQAFGTGILTMFFLGCVGGRFFSRFSNPVILVTGIGLLVCALVLRHQRKQSQVDLPLTSR